MVKITSKEGKDMREKLKSDFRNLQAWQKCRDLRIIIWNLCKEFPSEERFRLSDQMIRASRSATSNIAERGMAVFIFKRTFCFVDNLVAPCLS